MASIAGTELEGDLHLPRGAHGVVVFAHGSGSSRFSPRNQYVADELARRGLGTLLVDLLSHDEEVSEDRSHHLWFDVGMQADRLIGLVDWLAERPETRMLPVGLFGASTGAAAALVAAAARPDRVHAIVARGGRPDLAGPVIVQVQAPTLFVVGAKDVAVLDLNEQARETMTARAELHIVPDATHLFEEPGALAVVAEETATWFAAHLR
nr:dienelactone hydrolase family protein [Actinoplanes tereljensis]